MFAESKIYVYVVAHRSLTGAPMPAKTRKEAFDFSDFNALPCATCCASLAGGACSTSFATWTPTAVES